MHQSIPAVPIPPRATAGHLLTLLTFSKDEFIGKGEAFVKDCPSGTRKTCRRFSKGYYTKSGRLIPMAKRGKEIKNNQIFAQYFGLKKNLLRGLKENEYNMTVTSKSFEI